jgi:hypothetical protein
LKETRSELKVVPCVQDISRLFVVELPKSKTRDQFCTPCWVAQVSIVTSILPVPLPISASGRST